mgnify:CR=1 FL=1
MHRRQPVTERNQGVKPSDVTESVSQREQDERWMRHAMALAERAEGIGEIPVDYRARIGTSKVTGTVRGTARAVRDMRRVIRDDSFGGPRDSARAEWRNAGEPPG